ncbi:MAG: YaiI/YqxD family protein [Gammaproteobacteria bacterium]|jgi:uncharacterized protein
MRIWVDADACPSVIKDILFRAAERVGIETTLVANQPVRIPVSRYVKALQVAAGFDVADRHILQAVQQGDLVVTADIPLAADVVAKGGMALNPRGELYTTENIRERLAMRNLAEEIRATGTMTGGPSALSKRDRQAFANHLDRLLARHGRT